MVVETNIKAGVILSKLWGWLLFYLIFSLIVSVAYIEFHVELIIPNTEIAILGTALSILMGFRVNAAYDRWWEARKIWGSVVNQSRTLTREVIVFLKHTPDVEKLRDDIVYNQIAFVYAMNYKLRDKSTETVVKKFLKEPDATTVLVAKNVPNAILLNNLSKINDVRRQADFSDYLFINIEETFTTLTNNLGEAERIKNTPFPVPYSYFSFLLVHIFGCLIPFGLVDELGYITIAMTILVAFIFLVIERIAFEIQNPFENGHNDIALDAICVTIETDLKNMIGDENIPGAVYPVNGILM
ncbi:hypothetical protein GS399_10670 [Pedobacter sp. HMF7647]|uniref:Bestrophin n=1 Tax=Hufsiella arboris TaxID=2695275 RepID=A0A7K1YA06_9SPHI|nr:bestrophin family ion channel [Hufsiella arboris]MXV51433.1 hypothetical protein [Hufsiella arboris]